MLEMNLQRLIEASPFVNSISEETQDALIDFLIDTGATLENINIDNIIVNGITEMLIEEFQENYNEYEIDDFFILYKDNDNIAFLN